MRDDRPILERATGGGDREGHVPRSWNGPERAIANLSSAWRGQSGRTRRGAHGRPSQGTRTPPGPRQTRPGTCRAVSVITRDARYALPHSQARPMSVDPRHFGDHAVRAAAPAQNGTLGSVGAEARTGSDCFREARPAYTQGTPASPASWWWRWAISRPRHRLSLRGRVQRVMAAAR